MKNINQFMEHDLFWKWSEDSAHKNLEELSLDIKLYLIAKIWPHAHSWNEQVVSRIKPPITVFVPHQHNPYNTIAQSFKHEVHDVDLEAICKSQGALLLPPYGNDCSYEVGIYKMMNIAHGKGRILFPVIAVVKNDVDFLKDWMVKAGITHVITDNQDTYDVLLADPMLGSGNRSVYKIKSLDELHDTVRDIVLMTREPYVQANEIQEDTTLDFLMHTRAALIPQEEA